MATPAAPLTPTRWPDSLPHSDEEKIFSIVCGNTSIKWSLHEGQSMKFTPVCVWRTQHIATSDLDHGPTSVLARHLPTAGLQAVYGVDDDEGGTKITKELATAMSLSRANALITVYIVSTNEQQAKMVSWSFSETPSRVYVMQPNDFFTKRQGRYDTMGIDRLACIKAAAEITGFPALVIDGGTCMTYTMCDAEGKVRGGGICLGLLGKFAAITQNTKYAHGMTAVSKSKEILDYAADMVNRGEPLQVWSRDTKEAVTSTTLREVLFTCRDIIKHYLEEIGDQPEEAEVVNEVRFNGQVLKKTVGGKPKILIAGGDADLLTKMLQPDHNGLVPPDPTMRPYEVTSFKHMMPYGVAHTLLDKIKEFKDKPKSEFDLLLLGCRVAKEFHQPQKDGDRIYRGTITSSVRDGDGNVQHYLVLYDDVDTESMDLVAIHAALTLYSQVGEKVEVTAELKEKFNAKKAKSHTAAEAMEKQIDKVKHAAKAHVAKAKAATKPLPKPAPAPAPKAAAPAAAGAKRKATTSPATKSPTPKKPKKKDPRSYVNARVAKNFEGSIFFGNITAYDVADQFWSVVYDDGDEEEYDEEDLKHYTQMYREYRDTDTIGNKKKKLG